MMPLLPFFSSSRSASVALLLTVLAPQLPLQAQQGNLESLANREIVRRQEDLVVADQLIKKADRAAAEKDYETAYVNYLDALDRIPAGAATDTLRTETVGKFSRIGLLYAEQLIANGKYSDAERVAKTILLPEYDPANKAAVRLLSNLEQSDFYNKTITPQFATDREEVTKLLYEAEGFYQSGRFDLALKRYEQVLDIDRYNIAARKGMEQVNSDKTKYYGEAYNETRSRMLWLVDRSWERPVRHFQGGRSTSVDMAARGGVRGTEVITAKLNRIIIPKIDLRDTSVREAVEFLKQRSKELDSSTDDPKDKRGVNIVLKLDNTGGTVPTPDPAAPAPADGSSPVAPAGGNADTKITLSLSNVPLVEALRYLTELSGLKYKIEPYAVSIVPITENTTDLVTKEYRVPPGFIPANSAPGSDAATPGAPIDATSARIGGRTNAQEYLISQGVPFPAGSFAQYVPAGSKLIVRNTPDAVDLIDSLVDATVGVQPTQVEIESKFLEVTQNNLKELGFDWLLGPFAIGGGTYGSGGTVGGGIADVGGSPVTGTYPAAANYPFAGPGGIPIGAGDPSVGNSGYPLTGGNRTGVGNSAFSAVTANSIDALIAGIPQGANFAAPGIFGLSGIFTSPQFQVVIRALNQKKGVDLMSAPKVTTKSGRKALVRVVREFPYPTEFNPPEPPPPTTSDSIVVPVVGTITSQGIVTPSTPTAFETRNLGVTLEVEPIIGPDGYTIDLNLSPEVVEFDGFINYGSPILGPIITPALTIGSTVLTSNVINQPIFSVRKVTTSVSIWDGQTVALGGLIREDVQKVQDKVPLLGDIPLAGRLFRSNVDQKIKRNLIIFVTARLMDAEGRPVRQDDESEEPVEPLGLPQELPPPVFETARGPGK
ncbi:MAG: Amuc_1098 family type IV pilus outer membrane protein [Terrimicrobiaceae bacterium]